MKKLLILAASTLAALSIASATVPAVKRQNVNVLRVASAVVDSETVTIGTTVFEVDTTTVSGITTGNQRVDMHGGSTAAAVGTLTSDNTNAANTETVTIGSKVYTFKTALTPTEGEVLIGADADASLLNLIRAINHTGTSGTDYSVAVANTQVTAASAVTSHAFLVTARIPGAGANSFATTETSAHLAWGAVTLASGVSPTAGEFTTALETAVNATNVQGFRVRASRISANEVLLMDYGPPVPALAATETLAGSNNVFAAAAFFGGSQTFESRRGNVLISRAATATEATLLTMHFVAPYTPASAIVQVRSSAGAMKAFDGAITISGAIVNVNSSGSVTVASGDLVSILVTD